MRPPPAWLWVQGLGLVYTIGAGYVLASLGLTFWLGLNSGIRLHVLVERLRQTNAHE